MSEKMNKRYNRTVRRHKEKLIKEFLKNIEDCSFWIRLKFAFKIIFKF